MLDIHLSMLKECKVCCVLCRVTGPWLCISPHLLHCFSASLVLCFSSPQFYEGHKPVIRSLPAPTHVLQQAY